ncbi:class I SAM-dependent methyltransferase [SAR202 cluster bacterium AC-409-J13_OGT_754m]|nr:class I SAM-dependent methyltransferase [SAR202 cluster bacterium AC-409-J13_OGT_754m]
MSKNKPTHNRLYYDLAYLWPIFSPPEEYAHEADLWLQALREKLGPGQHSILDLGVGGGHLLSHLSSEFKATAVDISERMLANSIRLNDNVEHILGDMRSIRLNRKFSAVLLHDSVSYLVSEDELKKTFETAAAHLETGGLLITVPDWFRETFDGTFVEHRIIENEEGEFAFIEYVSDPDPSDSIIETIFFYILRNVDGIKVEEDRHITGIFSLETWERLMSESGFDVEVRPYPVYADDGEGYLLLGQVISS